MTRANFSERMGITPPKAVQVQGMDIDLRVSLWNGLSFYLDRLCLRNQRDSKYGNYLNGLKFSLWTKFFKGPYDNLPQEAYSHDFNYNWMQMQFWDFARKWYFNDRTQWHMIYGFLEFIGEVPPDNESGTYFAEVMNRELVDENSAYRFIGGKFAPITNEHEIGEIRAALTPPTAAFDQVSAHIGRALSSLSAKPQPDYPNSIKEAISAVESAFKVIANMPSASLGQALPKVGKELELYKHMEAGIKSLYDYTNDFGGIRHARKDESVPDQAEARFMLVISSAIANMVIEKARVLNKLPK